MLGRLLVTDAERGNSLQSDTQEYPSEKYSKILILQSVEHVRSASQPFNYRGSLYCIYRYTHMGQSSPPLTPHGVRSWIAARQQHLPALIFHAPGLIILVANLQNSFLKPLLAGAPKQHRQKMSEITIAYVTLPPSSGDGLWPTETPGCTEALQEECSLYE